MIDFPRSPLPPRKAYIKRHVRVKGVNVARAARRRKAYQAFIRSPEWRQQKRRVHERDGWQCTTLEDGIRCSYRKGDGPLHAHHEKYHPRGIEKTPDHHIHTVCPRHHDRAEVTKWWKHPKPY